jgi:hypothetical protein
MTPTAAITGDGKAEILEEMVFEGPRWVVVGPSRAEQAPDLLQCRSSTEEGQLGTQLARGKS